MTTILNNDYRIRGKHRTHFSTTSNRSGDDAVYYERNKKFIENSKEIEVRSESPVNKSLTSGQLQDLLEHNKQDINANISSADSLRAEGDHLYKKSTNLYGNHKGKLTSSQQELIDSNLGSNDTSLDKVSTIMSPEEQSLYDIGKTQKRLVDGIFKTLSLKENLPSSGGGRTEDTRDKHLMQSEDIIQKLNSLASNISILSKKNNDIQKEINLRDSSSYFPQDSSEVVQTDFSSYEPFDD